MASIIKTEEVITEVISSPSETIIVKNRMRGQAAIEEDEFVIKGQLKNLENSIAYLDGNNVFSSYNEFKETVIGVPADDANEFPILGQVKDLVRSKDPILVRTTDQSPEGLYTLSWNAARKEIWGKYGRFQVQVSNTYQPTSITIINDGTGAPASYIFELSGMESLIHIF